MDKLKKADSYIEKNKVSSKELPEFHVAPQIGWINDPNGFSYYNGKAHLFYQFHPYGKEWGPMHWGHCVSSDLIKWEYCPVALAPDMDYDVDGCFSGSAIATDKGHMLVYTGVSHEEINGERQEFQNQCIALGDGKSYKKIEKNPVITGDMMPENFSREHFRDPKVWKEDDGYYLVAGNKTSDGKPHVVLFYSENMYDWKYVSVLAEDNTGKYGTMWECPDFFELDKRHVLIASPQDMCADNEFHNGNNSVYFLGDYDKKQHKFNYDKVYTLDDGIDFYAPQTTLTPDGRRVMIGWMQSWDSNIRPVTQKWSCMMTIPRELTFADGRIVQSPVREIAEYYTDDVYYKGQKVHEKTGFQGINGRMLDMTVEIADGDFDEFKICFAENERFRSWLIYNNVKKELEINRLYSGMNRDTIGGRKVRLRYPKESLKLRFILDKYSAEIFINDGSQVLSMTYYTPLDADGISFECDGDTVINIEKHGIFVR